MDWESARILTLTPLQHYERRAIRLRKKSNRFTTYIRCACKEYKSACNERKKVITQKVFGRAISIVNVQVLKLARRYWSDASDQIKTAWQDRGEFIDSQPRLGILTRLPSTIPRETGARDKWIRLNLQEEARGLQRDMRTFVIQKKLKIVDPEKAIRHSFPHTVPIFGRIYKEMSISPFMRCAIFGDKFENLKSYENQTVNKKYAPAYIHFSTHTRTNSVFRIEDVIFVSHIEEETDTYFHLTSGGVLTHHNGGSYKCWGWSETDDKITFIYSHGENNTPAKLTVFDRPKFVSEKIVSRNNKNITQRSYKTDTETYNSDGFQLSNYCPVCIKFHFEKNNIFNIVGTRLAVRIDDNNVFIVTGDGYSG